MRSRARAIIVQTGRRADHAGDVKPRCQASLPDRFTLEVRGHLTADLLTSRLERLSTKLERAAKDVEHDDAMSHRFGWRGPRRAWLCALDARPAAAPRASDRPSRSLACGTCPRTSMRSALRSRKLRYAAELAAEVGRRRIAADIAALKTAQDLLGRLHDLPVLVGWAREVQASLSPPDLTAWRELGPLAQAVDNDCRHLLARYIRDRAQLVAIADRVAARQSHGAAVGRRATG
jgi:CHAD domain-containing protein